ncbi:MAG: Mrp/NBP35 family ATP-binding protein [Deltaproteobacteria bacterium]|nr:Mrp/NBP35 family ATP-binding protein [Deltaproteobacteria bacterium]
MMKHIVPVMSGKGGVGKSTVAVNLAIALAKLGHRVALIDADFYGPSIPTLMGGGDVIPDHENRLIPPEKYGIKYISLGFFLSNPDDAVIWRGPMFNKALNQLFSDVNWGEVEYCIVDMPPGTGDAQISLTQNLKLSGALVVTTPQEVALADVRKAINMLSKVNVDVLGIVENMAGFVTPQGDLIEIFGSGGGERTAKQFGVPLLASIPIDTSIREGGDKGVPVSSEGDESQAAKLYRELALQLVDILDKKHSSEEALRVIN